MVMEALIRSVSECLESNDDSSDNDDFPLVDILSKSTLPSPSESILCVDGVKRIFPKD